MFDVTLLILLGLAALGFISHNTTVAVSILVLIIVRVTPLSTFFPWIEKQGLSIGIIILTIGVMAPIASGTLPPSTLIHSFLNWKSLVAIAVGIFVSWLGGRGVTLMSSQPSLVAGLLGLRPDDPRLPDSFALAEEQGMAFTIHPVELRSAHPNTAVLHLTARSGRELSIKAASVGGGRIRVTEIDGVPADFGGDSNTLIIHNEDTPGCIAEVTMSLALRRINIASMQVFRAAVGRYAVMVLECDSHIPHTLEQQLAVMPGLLKVTCLNVDEPEGMEE